jgi:hypothetical protein
MNHAKSMIIAINTAGTIAIYGLSNATPAAAAHRIETNASQIVAAFDETCRRRNRLRFD